ncbi:hypothetical protein ACIQM4_24990 [Streptomyces sp. NPDC091272]|uniref:hypothetical protein n=1 Tax=Streptomyces sp. NPDC091272 TaxID=3365981 RepID=UPI00381A36C6
MPAGTVRYAYDGNVMYNEFTTPEQQEFLDTFGEWPVVIEGNVHQVTLYDEKRETLVLSFDPLGQSIRIRWTDSDGRELLDVFREGATHLRITNAPGSAGLVAQFKLEEQIGEMHIQVFPGISIRDQMLFA